MMVKAGGSGEALDAEVQTGTSEQEQKERAFLEGQVARMQGKVEKAQAHLAAAEGALAAAEQERDSYQPPEQES